MKYHVTNKWDGEDLESAELRFGTEEAIEMFCKKWDTEDVAFAQSQINNIYLFDTMEQAVEHQKFYGGEILEIDDEYIDTSTDTIEGFTVAYDNKISKEYIKKI